MSTGEVLGDSVSERALSEGNEGRSIVDADLFNGPAFSVRARRDGGLICRPPAQTVQTLASEAYLNLSAPTLEPSQNGVLDPAQNRAVLKVKPYPGMASGDKLVLSWKGIDSAGATYVYKAQRFVSNAQIGKEMVFVVRSPHIAALDGGSLEVYYTLNNAQLNGPVESPRLQLEVGDVSQELLAARVDDATGGWLAPEQVAEGARVTIRPYVKMAVGDTVFLSWVGNTPGHGFSDSLRVEAFAVGSDISFWVEPHYITPNLGSLVTFSYFVEHPGQAIRYSEQAQVMIGVRKPLPLGKANVLEVDEGELDLRDALDGVTVVIDEPGVERGELVYLKCDGANFSHRDSMEASGDSETVFIVPYRFWSEHQDSTVRVSYSVERLDDTSQVSDVLDVYVRSGDLAL